MSNKVSITDLLGAIGSENISFQPLSKCVLDIKAKSSSTEITFATDAIKPIDVFANTGPSGLVLWVDGDLYKQRFNELKNGNYANITRAIVLESLVATFEREGSGTREIDGQRYVSIDHLKDMAAAIRQLKSSGGAI
ncbi:hypothetical protein HQ399_05665 [Aeromonas jandaei]|uniref:Uncharacterized protein n=1 Tax=Aeromonas jandaei TaxID=650 RepID=A0ABD7EL01_AERJA|nr:hypothetical protein [Aeromonas jandaei]QWL61764.1 hypothetical protein HQ399_05665 [Aeromonas jandaei]